MVQRLTEVRPATLGQALRIPGVTPAAVAVVSAYIDRVSRGSSRFDSLRVWRHGISARGWFGAPPRPDSSPPTTSLTRSSEYYELLSRWNRKINLTALSDPDEAIDRLLLEPLAAARHLPERHSLLHGHRLGRRLSSNPAEAGAPPSR